MTAKDFIETIKTGKFSRFEEMLHENPKLAETFDEDLSATALLVAVYYGRTEFVDHLTKINFPLSIWESAATGNRQYSPCNHVRY